jgi:putative hydroxymethylpyrimidine transport system substrate-binding protein
MIPRLATIAALSIALVTAGCGEKQENLGGSVKDRTKVTVLLDWTPNADHAPIYAAKASGAFDRAGLDVELKTPSDPTAGLKLAAARKVDLAISYQPDLLLARDKGLRVAAVGALVQKPLTSLMSLDPKIRSVKDLRGKTVGTAGIPYQSAYLKAILEKAAVPESSVKEVGVGFNLTGALVSGKADATLGAFWNIEGLELKKRGKKPWIAPVDEVGVPDYQELIFVSQMDDLKENGKMLRRFMQAMAEGAKSLKADPTPAVDALLAANRGLDRASTTASVTATIPVFTPDDDRFPWGFMDTRDWEAYGNWLLENGLIKSAPTPTSLTNEYLPGRGI